MRLHKSCVAPMMLGMAMAVTVAVSSARAGSVTGDPSADGWMGFGNSLSNGVYVDGSANYGFQTFGAGFTVDAGSNLEIADGSLSWLAGDTVVGVGGVFEDITAAAAGWGAFSGTGVNSLFGSLGPKLQVKFGTSAASWTTSTAAPGAGNASGSSSLGGARVQVRTSAYFSPDIASSGEGYTWDDNSGQVLVLDKDDHITWSGDSGVAKEVARMIWVWDGGSNRVGSWELLLNVSLLHRQTPGFASLFPTIGDLAIMTVQDGDNTHTNALVSTQALPTVVPVPAAVWGGMMLLSGLGAVTGLKRRLRRD